MAEPTDPRSEKSVRAVDLVGTVEIAQRVGVRDHNVVNNWRRRHADFPQPLVTLGLGRVWSWPDVEEWARRTGRMPDGLAICHTVGACDSIEVAARAILGRLRDAAATTPQMKRHLYLDIAGHRDGSGSFDDDMVGLQRKVLADDLMPFLTKAHMPLGTIANSATQSNDLPDTLDLRTERSVADGPIVKDQRSPKPI